MISAPGCGWLVRVLVEPPRETVVSVSTPVVALISVSVEIMGAPPIGDDMTLVTFVPVLVLVILTWVNGELLVPDVTGEPGEPAGAPQNSGPPSPSAAPMPA